MVVKKGRKSLTGVIKQLPPAASLLKSGKYSGADLRKLRAERGVGPVRKLNLHAWRDRVTKRIAEEKGIQHG